MICPGLASSPSSLISYISSGHPVTETSNILARQEDPLGDLQNDIHHMADSLPGLWKALTSNLTAAMTEANQTELGEYQAPWAEVEPDHTQVDEWEGRQEGPNLRGPPGEGVCSIRACVKTCICYRVSWQILGASAAFQPHLEEL